MCESRQLAKQLSAAAVMDLLLESHEAANKQGGAEEEEEEDEEGAEAVAENRQAGAAAAAAVAAAEENVQAAEIEQAVATLTGPLREDIEMASQDEGGEAALVHEGQEVQWEPAAAEGDGVMEDVGMAAEEREETGEGEGAVVEGEEDEEARQPVGKRRRGAELDFVGLRSAAAMNSPWQAWIAKFPRSGRGV